MSSEGQNVDRKSLKLVTGKTADWEELAKDCVAFANAQGGRLLLGIEDGETEPVSGQRIPMELAEKVRKRISELTVNVAAVSGWIGRLLDWEIVRQVGRTKGKRYFVDPALMAKMEFPSQTTLAHIEPHRLRALLLEDLQRHPGSALSEIRRRIGSEIPEHQIRRQLSALAKEGEVCYEGEKRWRRYRTV